MKANVNSSFLFADGDFNPDATCQQSSDARMLLTTNVPLSTRSSPTTSPENHPSLGGTFSECNGQSQRSFSFQTGEFSENVWLEVNRLLKAQILRNQRFAEILSPIRKREQQMMTEKKKRSVQKQIRRKFSITNGFKSKAFETSSKSHSRVSASITRWQHEISRRCRLSVVPSTPSAADVQLTPKIEPIN